MAEIKKTALSPEGPQFSEIIQGYWRMESWNRTTEEHLTFLKEGIDRGVTTVDHAPVYDSEPLFGKILKREPSLRNQIEIVSKCGIIPGDTKKADHYDSSGSAIIESVNTTLKHLNTDHLDALLLHRPDYLMEPAEVAEAFETLEKSGKVAHFGVSNFSPSQFELLQSMIPQKLVTNQVELNPINVEMIDNGVLDQLQMHHIRPMAWSCLGGGALFTETTEQVTRLKKVLEYIRREVNASSIESVIYAWVRRHPSSPITVVGTGQISRVEKAIDSLDITLNREQWYRILEASRGVPIP